MARFLYVLFLCCTSDFLVSSTTCADPDCECAQVNGVGWTYNYNLYPFTSQAVTVGDLQDECCGPDWVYYDGVHCAPPTQSPSCSYSLTPSQMASSSGSASQSLTLSQSRPPLSLTPVASPSRTPSASQTVSISQSTSPLLVTPSPSNSPTPTGVLSTASQTPSASPMPTSPISQVSQTASPTASPCAALCCLVSCGAAGDGISDCVCNGTQSSSQLMSPSLSATPTHSPSPSDTSNIAPVWRQLANIPLPYCPTVDSAAVRTILPGCSADIGTLYNASAGVGAINATSSPVDSWCACEPGAFPDLAAGGACHACPPAAQGFAVTLPIVRLAIFVLVGGIALAFVTGSALFIIGAPVISGVSRTLQLAAYVLAMLQVIAQTGSSVGPCLPDFLRDALAVVAPLVLESSVFTPAACAVVTSSGSLLWADLFPSQMSTLLVADVFVAVLLVCDNVGRSWRRFRRSYSSAVALCTSTGKFAGLSLLMITPIALRTAVGLLDCPVVSLPVQVASALKAWNGGGEAGISGHETSDVLLPLLRSQPYIICYGNVHAGVAATAVSTIIIVLFLLPAAMCASLHVARYRALGILPSFLLGPGCRVCKGRFTRSPAVALVPDVPAQVRERLMQLHSVARAVDAMSQTAWIRGAKSRPACPGYMYCNALCRCCRRFRAAACGSGREMLAEIQILPPPPPAPCSLASFLARRLPTLHRALFSPPSLPPVTSLSVEDLALHPYLLVANPTALQLGPSSLQPFGSSRNSDLATGSDAAVLAGRRLASGLVDVTPMVRENSNTQTQTSIENLLFAGDYRPSLASLAIIDSSAMALIIVIAAALPVASPNSALAGLRAGLTIIVCLALGWSLLEHKPFVGADVSKLALRELTLIVYGGCATLALFCSSCSPDPRGLLVVSIATLVAILLVPIAAFSALLLTAQRAVDAPKMRENGASTRLFIQSSHATATVPPNARALSDSVPRVAVTRISIRRADSSVLNSELSARALSPRTLAAAGASNPPNVSSRKIFGATTLSSKSTSR